MLLGSFAGFAAAMASVGLLVRLGHADVLHDPWVAFFGQVTLYGGALGTLFLLLWFRRHLPPAALGWRIPAAKWIWFGLAAIPVVLVGSTAMLHVLNLLFPSVVNPQCSVAQSGFGQSPLLAYIAIAGVAPIVEETIFRGFIYGWLRAHFELKLAMFLGALVFAFAHSLTGLPVMFVIPLTAIGLVLVWLYQKSGSIAPGAITHSGFNLVNAYFILQGIC
jgi:membrane protease YdiL (CAAX protease family)